VTSPSPVFWGIPWCLSPSAVRCQLPAFSPSWRFCCGCLKIQFLRFFILYFASINLNSNKTVHYHKDWLTKNKRMFRFPAFGLFLTCTENSFLSGHTYIFKWEHICYWKKRNPLTWEECPSFMAANFPSTQVACSKPTALCPLHFPSSPMPAPCIQSIYFYIYKNDINKLDSYFRHKSSM
jgi:hypothetical protein